MTTSANQELRHAQGVVERRLGMMASLHDAETQKQAMQNHQEICGAVREVSRHRHNILQRIDNETALQAIQVGELHQKVNEWLEESRVVLSKWGIRESDVKRMEGGLLEWV